MFHGWMRGAGRIIRRTALWYVYPLSRLLGQGRAKAPEITDKHTGQQSVLNPKVQTGMLLSGYQPLFSTPTLSYHWLLL